MIVPTIITVDDAKEIIEKRRSFDRALHPTTIANAERLQAFREAECKSIYAKQVEAVAQQFVVSSSQENGVWILTTRDGKVFRNSTLASAYRDILVVNGFDIAEKTIVIER